MSASLLERGASSTRAVQTTIPELLEMWAETRGNKVCFRYLLTGDVDGPVAAVSYRELWNDVRSIAAGLHELGMEGERAMLLYPHGLDFIKAFLGCLLARVIAVPLYHRQHASALEAIAEDSGARLLLTTDTLSSGLVTPPAASRSRLMEMRRVETNQLCHAHADTYRARVIPSDSLAFLQYTSGSTSRPKGVMVTHRNVVENLGFLMEKVGHVHRHVVMWLPFYHDMGLIGGLLWTIYAGLEATLLSPSGFLKRPYRWLRAISKLRATTMVAPDFSYDLVVERTTREQRETLDLSSVCLAVDGAEPIRAETIEKFCDAFAVSGFRPDAFYPCYGLAEATLLASAPRALSPVVIESFDAASLKLGRAVPVERAGAPAVRLVGCGSSPAAQRLEIVSPETQRRLPERQVGEIWISGPCVTAGYWNKAEVNRDVFHAGAADETQPGDEFLRTGDLGFMHDGSLFITGRIKDVIILHGQNIYPQDIEGTVERTFSFVSPGACAAFALVEDSGDRLVLLVEIPKGRYPEANDIMDQIREAVWAEHLLSVYAVVLLPRSAIPKTTSGKVRRFKCREQFLAGGFNEVARSLSGTRQPTTRRAVTANAVEQETARSSSVDGMRSLLVDVLSEYTRVSADVIDMERPLYTYGLDSIRLLELTRDLEVRLARSLSPMTLYNYSSIDALAKYLSEPQQRLMETRDTRAAVEASAGSNAALQPAASCGLAEQPAPRAPCGATRALSSMRERTLATRDVELRVCEWGPASGHTVLCVHGIKDQGASWLMVARELAAKGMHVVAPDLRGHGHSTHVTSYHIAGFLADVGALMDDLFHGELFTLVGHSMGAQVVALMAALRPEFMANLVLVEPPLERESVWHSPFERIRMLRELSSKSYRHAPLSSVGDAAELIARAAPGLPLDIAHELAERHTRECDATFCWRWDAKLNAHYQCDGVFSAEFGFAELLSRLEVRVGVVQGQRGGAHEESSHEQFAGVSAHTPTARYILPGGHNLHLESPIDLAAVIEREFRILHG